MSPEVYQEIVKEWNQALPNLVAGLPDRTDLMIPLDRSDDWGETKMPKATDIKAAVMEVYGVTQAELYSRGRRDVVAVEARSVCYYVMHKYAGLSSSDIGITMHRDHSSVLTAKKKYCAKLGVPEKQRRLQRVLRMLGVS